MNDERFRVCSDFFHRTLDISTKMTKLALQNKSSIGTLAKEDQRGRKISHNKTPTEEVERVKRNINIFPRMESHYCRTKSTKLYLHASLNITKMYKLYLEWITDNPHDNDQAPVTHQMYRRIFCDNFNLAFYRPKNDQCSTCEGFENVDKTDENIK